MSSSHVKNMAQSQLCKCLDTSNLANEMDDSCSHCVDECEGLEWKWRESEENSASVLVSRRGSLITFHRRYSSGTAAVRGNTTLVPNRHYYWELHMCNELYGTDIMIGVGTPNVALDTSAYKFASLLGQDRESWGFSYTGRVQHGGRVHRYGKGFRIGDVVGVHLDTWHGTISFFVNKKPLGVAFRGLQKHQVLYPMVCSTAAQISMLLVTAVSRPASLFLYSARVLTQQPTVLDRLRSVPGMKHLFDDVFWLLMRITSEIDNQDDDDDTCHYVGGGNEMHPLSMNTRSANFHRLALYKAQVPDVNVHEVHDEVPPWNMRESPDIFNEMYSNLGSEEEVDDEAPPRPAAMPVAGFRAPLCQVCNLRSVLYIRGAPEVALRCLNCYYIQVETNPS